MSWNSLRRTSEDELIDNPSVSVSDIERAMGDVAKSNVLFGGLAAVNKAITTVLDGQKHFKSVRILDIGTGSGDIPRGIRKSFSRRGQECDVIAIDYMQQMLEIASSRNTDAARCAFVQADAARLPFLAKSFDFAVCALTFHHLDDGQAVAALQEMDRVTKFGFVVTDLRRDRITAAIVKFGLNLACADPMTMHDSAASVRRAFIPRDFEKLIALSSVANVRIQSHLYYRLVVLQKKLTAELG